MSKRRTLPLQADPPPQQETARAVLVHVVEPLAVYSTPALREALGLKTSTLRREIREGRLRVLKRAGKHFFLGEHVLDWLRGGELKRRRPALNGVAHSEE